MDAITANARKALEGYGIAINDVRINRTELPAGTEESVYARMKTERDGSPRRTGPKATSARAGSRRGGPRGAVIVANARREAEIQRGPAMQARRDLRRGLRRGPRLLRVPRSLEAYRKTIDGKTTFVLSPDTEFFKYLEGQGRE